MPCGSFFENRPLKIFSVSLHLNDIIIDYIITFKDIIVNCYGL
jgi:hypothetical protein